MNAWRHVQAVEFALYFGIKCSWSGLPGADGRAGSADQIRCPSIDGAHMAAPAALGKGTSPGRMPQPRRKARVDGTDFN